MFYYLKINKLNYIINTKKDSREIKRVLSVKKIYEKIGVEGLKSETKVPIMKN